MRHFTGRAAGPEGVAHDRPHEARAVGIHAPIPQGSMAGVPLSAMRVRVKAGCLNPLRDAVPDAAPSGRQRRARRWLVTGRASGFMAGDPKAGRDAAGAGDVKGRG